MKQKFFVFLNSLLVIVLEALYVAVYILLGYGLTQLVNYTIGAKWPQIMEYIRYVTLIVVGIVGALRFIARTTIRTYRELKKEIRDEHHGDH